MAEDSEVDDEVRTLRELQLVSASPLEARWERVLDAHAHADRAAVWGSLEFEERAATLAIREVAIGERTVALSEMSEDDCIATVAVQGKVSSSTR